MDKSLDEIIKTSKTGRGKARSVRRGGPRQQVLGTQALGANPVQRARRTATATPAAPTTPHISEKIIVSNLPMDVNEAQVKELFHTTVGPLREVTLHYDANGKSKGIATVTFQKKGDGAKAYNQYNNRLIDGKRPMKIEVVVDPSRPAPAASLASRVAPAPAAANGTAPMEGVQRTGGRPGRGRGGRGGRAKKAPKSAADLDAEMEDYFNGGGGGAPQGQGAAGGVNGAAAQQQQDLGEDIDMIE